MRWIYAILFLIGLSASGQSVTGVKGDWRYDDNVQHVKSLTIPSDTSHTALNNSIAIKDGCFYLRLGNVWRKEFCDTSLGGIGSPLAILSNPSNVTVTEGASASFSASATGGTTPYSYHWQKVTTPISGATSTTYTIGSTVLTDSGNYKLTVTDALSATATTTYAHLTVNAASMAVTVTYGYGSSDPYVDDATAPTIGSPGTTSVVHNATVAINFSSAAPDHYIIIKLPSTESLITAFNNGTNTLVGNVIPEYEFRAPFTVGGFTYIVSRNPIAFDYTQPLNFLH